MKPLRVIIVALSLLIAGGGAWLIAQFFWFSPDIVVSKETTWLTEPLADDGLPDYAAYLLEQGREGVTPENNGAVPFLQAMWPAWLDERHQQLMCDHLGMGTPSQQGLKQLNADGELTAKILAWWDEGGRDEGEVEGENSGWSSPQVRMEMLLEKVASGPWRREECPPLAEWIDQHAPEFDLLYEAANRPRFFCPSPTLFTQPKDPLILMDKSVILSMRAAGEALAVRSCLSLGEGDVGAAWRDCEHIYRLARQIPGDHVNDLLVAATIESSADDLTLVLLESPSLTEETASEMLAFQRSRQLRSSTWDAVDRSERLMFITAVMVLAGKREMVAMTRQQFLEQWDLAPFDGINADWNIVLKEALTWYDKLVAAARVDDLAERRRRLDQIEIELDTLRSEIPGQIPGAIVSREARSRAMADILVSLNIHVVAGFPFFMEERGNIRAQLLTVAAGLAKYRIIHGEYPEALDQLVPSVLEDVPIDMYGQPFVYKRTAQGYLLYSTGMNGIDESGSHEMYSIYKGYSVGEDQSFAREALGLPPVAETGDGQHPAVLPLEERIPQGADDWSIRLPLPRPKPPIP